MLSCRAGFNPTTSSKYLVIFVYWRERHESLKILSSLVTDSPCHRFRQFPLCDRVFALGVQGFHCMKARIALKSFNLGMSAHPHQKTTLLNL
jgi:hypothetical protein